MVAEIDEFVMKQPNLTEFEILSFRERVLKNQIDLFVPKRLQIHPGYFNTSERAKARLLNLNIAKQRKLHGFFGLKLPESDLKLQVLNKYPALMSIESINSTASAVPTQDPWKKTDKLKNFFGSVAPATVNVELTPNLSDSSLPSALDKNELHRAIKMANIKKAKKLSLMLGNTMSGSNMKKQKSPPLESNTPASLKDDLGSILFPGVQQSIDSMASSPEIDPKKQQQAKLEKLSQVLGQRIGVEQIVPPIVSDVIRPLTSFERALYKKKAEKLGRIFGTTVNVNEIVDYSKFLIKEPSAMSSDVDRKSNESINGEPEKITQILKVRKLYHILGSWPSSKSDSDISTGKEGNTP